MDMSIDVKCAITTAILSVLIYLLLVNLLQRGEGSSQSGGGVAGAPMNETEWYKSMEVLMLVSVFFAFNLNNYLFTSCKSA
jgi:hypothetical protein